MKTQRKAKIVKSNDPKSEALQAALMAEMCAHFQRLQNERIFVRGDHPTTGLIDLISYQEVKERLKNAKSA